MEYRFSYSQTQSQKSRNSKWKRDFYCFRCGDKNHKVKNCSNPIRCYNCGVVGHKRSSCPLTFNSFLNSDPSFPISGPKDHHYYFVLEFFKFRSLFLDSCVGNKEECNYLFNKVHWHFNCLTADNIGKYSNHDDWNGFLFKDFSKNNNGFMESQWIDFENLYMNDSNRDLHVDIFLLEPAVRDCCFHNSVLLDRTTGDVTDSDDLISCVNVVRGVPVKSVSDYRGKWSRY